MPAGFLLGVAARYHAPAMMFTRPSAIVPGLLILLPAVLPAALTGCGQPSAAPAVQTGGGGASGETLDRMIASYDDLASRKFQVLADFEDPTQAALFRREPAGSGDAPAVSSEQARRETGTGALKMPLYTSAQRIIAEDTPDSGWSLHRDWRGYDLLLMSVFSPRRIGGFRVEVRGGTARPLTCELPRMMLDTGWNLIRVDLADLVDRVDLAHVRAVTFGCDQLETPVDLYLDDLILVDNARDLFGSPDAPAGSLYVRSVGRGLIVGAVDRFELVISRGQIRRWLDPGGDHSRNLVGIGPLGPVPVVLPGGQVNNVQMDDPAQWNPLGIAAQVQQTLLETTPLHAVVSCDWRFGLPGGGGSGAVHRWVYTIYRDGRIYVECSGTLAVPSWKPDGVGMMFCCDSDAGFSRRVVDVNATTPAPPGAPRFCVFARAGRKPDLLVVPFRPLAGFELDSEQDPRVCVLWRLEPPNDRFTFAAMLHVGLIGAEDIENDAVLAADYTHPLPLALDAGRFVRTDPGDFDGDGFAEARGHYVLELDNGSAAVRVQGEPYVRNQPLFKIVDVAGRNVWVYADGKQIREVHRLRDGGVIFEVPGPIGSERLVEITSRPIAPAPADVPADGQTGAFP